MRAVFTVIRKTLSVIKTTVVPKKLLFFSSIRTKKKPLTMFIRYDSPGLPVNEIHALYVKCHKVSLLSPNPHQNASN